jgi:hypothetical protein
MCFSRSKGEGLHPCSPGPQHLHKNSQLIRIRYKENISEDLEKIFNENLLISHENVCSHSGLA